MQQVSVLNYLTSHDDGQPFDKERTRVLEAANKLLLAPGAAQIYYGDEVGRPLQVQGANGDANLRSVMSWALDDTREQYLLHWTKLGQFRREHLAVGAGRHMTLQNTPYLCRRRLSDDMVLIGLDWPSGTKEIPVYGNFSDGTSLEDHYSVNGWWSNKER